MAYGFGPVNAPNNTPTSQVDGSPTVLDSLRECIRLDIWVSNNPIFYQLQGVPPGRQTGTGPSQGFWLPQRYIPAASGQTVFVSLDRKFTGIRVWNAVSGSIAVVVVECLEDWELPDGG